MKHTITKFTIQNICFFACILCSNFLYSQISVDSIKNSNIEENKSSNDNQELVETLDNYKNKNKFNGFIYKLFVKKKKHSTPKIETQIPKSDNKEFQGKPIRNIYIETFDPFGHSLNDNSNNHLKFAEKVGNFLHPKTKEFVIRDYLLFKKGENYDSLRISESERLIRSQRFIRQVTIETQEIADTDSLDIYIKTLDAWSLIPQVNYSSNRVDVRLRDRNFMGLGHDFDNRFRKDIETGKNRIQSSYTIPNILRSFIGFNVGFYEDEFGAQSRGFSLYRNFISPLTRWAGGIYIGERTYYDSIPNNLEIKSQEFNYNLQDYWGGISFHLGKSSNHPKELNNLVFAARYFKVDYDTKPSPILDPNDFYSNEEFYLFSVGISERNYVQDRYVRNFEIIEDIPIGKSFGITGGFQNKNNDSRFYYASKFKIGNYYKLGFLGLNLEYGGFLKNYKTEQSVFSVKTQYFSHLLNYNRWNFRFFLNSNIIIGNNRFDSRGDLLTLNQNDPLGIPGFYSRDVIGNKKWISNLLIQSYSPYQLWGFRISPFMQGNFGLISPERSNLFSGKLYSRIGLGVSLTNDYLIFSNFRISFSWYNSIPSQGNHIFKSITNDYEDFNLMDFGIGKPTLIEYNPNLVY